MYNAANEIAAEAFLDGVIRFPCDCPDGSCRSRRGGRMVGGTSYLGRRTRSRQLGAPARARTCEAGGLEPDGVRFRGRAFAIGIAASIALHECGALYGRLASLGMKVRRYFVGFGPKVFSVRRGETEYGLKGDPSRRVLRHRGDDGSRRVGA